MSARQRSKTGCWTCRLRKKKCFEDGPPCANCRQFGVLCHGYGPRPTWKDRGDLEKEEARRIRLDARRQKPAAIPSSDSVESSMEMVTASSAEYSTGLESGSQMDLQAPPSPPLQREDSDVGPFPGPQWDYLAFDCSFPLDDDIWIDDTNYHLTPYMPLPMLPPPPQLPSHQSDASLSGPESQSLPNDSHLGIKASDSDIALVMDFVESTFGRQYLSCRHPSTPQKTWLLCLMVRCPTFFHTSLSMSAYMSHLDESKDSSVRELSFRRYQRHRDLAIRSFNAVHSHPPAVQREPIICGVHLALLEALGNNMQGCQSHLASASKALAEGGLLLEPTSELLCFSHLSDDDAGSVVSTENGCGQGEASLSRHGSSSPLPSRMERTAAIFFTALFIWNDILCAAAETRIPDAEGLYRNYLSDMAFSLVTAEITGCDARVLRSVMDITALEVSKLTQLSDGTLSVRDLVHRACKIETALENELKRLPSQSNNAAEDLDELEPHQPHPDPTLRARVFGHAALIYLNTVVSGALTGVPEIHNNICQILPSWTELSKASNFKYLAWAYSTTASLAAPSQRTAFRDMMANLPPQDSGLTVVQDARGGVEECWKEIDRHAPSMSSVPCDWRETELGAPMKMRGAELRRDEHHHQLTTRA